MKFLLKFLFLFRLLINRYFRLIGTLIKLNQSFFQIKFEEVFAEPEGTYSFGTVWGASFRVFTDTKLWCYRFLSSACAVPCALCWGVHFACLSFAQIWLYTPGFRSFRIQMRPASKVFAICANSFVAPCFEAFGRLFSSIRIHKATD